MQRQFTEELTAEQLKAAATISKVMKERAETATKFARALKDKDSMVQGYQQLSEEVAEEYDALSKTYLSKVPALETIAQKRLKKNKTLKDKGTPKKCK